MRCKLEQGVDDGKPSVELTGTATSESTHSDTGSSSSNGLKTPNYDRSFPSSPMLSSSSNRGERLSRSNSSQDDWEAFPPLDRLTVFDLLDNLALPQRLEKLQQSLAVQTEKVRRQREKIKSSGINAKDRVVEEWRRRVPLPDEQLEKYRKKMRDGVDRLGRRWNDTKAVTTREKVSFIAGVLNIFICGYLIGARPDVMHAWYTIQMVYFMSIRTYTYRKRGYHYFLADLCYFVNGLAIMSIWFFPQSKRLFLSTYCLAYGNNAVAIAMWRNSMVFHSLDKMTSLFIHIMPPVVLHCIVHLIPPDMQRIRFPAVYHIKNDLPHDPERYSLLAMIFWATIPYALWQLTYHIFITVRRRDKIAAGRPTSFTWLKKSYSKSWIGKAVLALPDVLQQPAFMLIQYTFALITMLPCTIWFKYRWMSAIFLLAMFSWSIYNGATFYIDVFGNRFQNELEQLKREVARWQTSPDLLTSPELAEKVMSSGLASAATPTPGQELFLGNNGMLGSDKRISSVDHIPLLDGRDGAGPGAESGGAEASARDRE